MQTAARPTWRAELLWKTALWPSVCQCWAREMAHSIKCLPCKHEDLILSLRTRENQLVQWSALACNPSIGKTGPRGSLGLTGYQSSSPCHKNQGGQPVVLWPTHTPTAPTHTRDGVSQKDKDTGRVSIRYPIVIQIGKGHWGGGGHETLPERN